jgi:O-antigen ligase
VIVVRPPLGARRERVFDGALAVCLLVLALQLIPLPGPVRSALSPAFPRVHEALWLDGGRQTAGGPLSIDPGATAAAFALAVAVVLVFWTARGAFAEGGVRAIGRGVAWTGLALAVVAMAQHATAPGLLYWRWPTIFGSAFGPYRNRNDFSTWLIMAIPLTVGYAFARVETRLADATRSSRLDAVVDATAVWLAGSVSLMSAALVTSLSRSGLAGAASALAAFLWFGRRKLSTRGRMSLLAGAGVLLLIAFAYVNVSALADRVNETLASGIGGRGTIWRETLPMVRDFWMTGIGAGAYERGMLVYQRTRGLFYFNHAHDEYLQFAAEGGVLLSVPIAIVLVAGAGLIARRLQRDDAPAFWIRAGAASGLVAVAVQSVWDTGLRMPANALLFALVAAVALHRRTREATGAGGTP